MRLHWAMTCPPFSRFKMISLGSSQNLCQCRSCSKAAVPPGISSLKSSRAGVICKESPASAASESAGGGSAVCRVMVSVLLIIQPGLDRSRLPAFDAIQIEVVDPGRAAIERQKPFACHFSRSALRRALNLPLEPNPGLGGVGRFERGVQTVGRDHVIFAQSLRGAYWELASADPRPRAFPAANPPVSMDRRALAPARVHSRSRDRPG